MRTRRRSVAVNKRVQKVEAAPVAANSLTMRHRNNRKRAAKKCEERKKKLAGKQRIYASLALMRACNSMASNIGPGTPSSVADAARSKHPPTSAYCPRYYLARWIGRCTKCKGIAVTRHRRGHNTPSRCSSTSSWRDAQWSENLLIVAKIQFCNFYIFKKKKISSYKVKTPRNLKIYDVIHFGRWCDRGRCSRDKLLKFKMTLIVLIFIEYQVNLNFGNFPCNCVDECTKKILFATV